MPEIAIFGIVALVIGGVIALMIWSYIAEKKRVEALRQVALQYHLQFNASRSGSAPDFDPFLRGDNRYCENTLTGRYDNRPVQMGDYHYETHSTDSKGRRQTHHHRFSYCWLQIPNARLHSLFIRPEGFFDKLTAMVGFDDIDFESAEFSKKFYVKGPDRKFAYAIVHQRMMEFLLAYPQFTIHLGDPGILILLGESRWEADQFMPRAEFATQFLAQIPAYVWDAYSV